MKDLIQKFIDDEGGLTVVEYAVAGGLIVGALILAFTNLGTAVATKIGDIQTAIE